MVFIRFEIRVLTILSVLAMLFVLIGSVSAADTNDTQIISASDNDEILSVENDINVLGEGEYNYTQLKDQIRSGGDITLTVGNYTYVSGDGDTIEITTSGVIDGNGAVIDMANSGHRAFSVTTSGVTIKNLTIKNANFNGNGGAIYLSSSGTVENCNFTANQASGSGGAVYVQGVEGIVTNCNFTANQASGSGGAVYVQWIHGIVTNCNFTANQASSGGAISMNYGGVTNCNFTNNTATNGDGGAVYFDWDSIVTNCNFTGNKATGDYSEGGAIWIQSGSVTNCNFADNSASGGGAIFSNRWYSIADTCIFKRNSGENVNTVIFSPTLNVDNFTTFYGSGEKLTFDLKTNSGIPVTNGNISISVYFKNNDSWVGNYNCLSDEGWTVDLPVGSYYAIFDTEYAEFKPINRTIKVIPNIKYYANVTSFTTNNRTVNITAKSNIPQDILEGKLLFILPNGTEINASYATNGTWWALHTFDDAGDYNINATYIGLDNVTINNATIRIMNVIPINTSDISIYFGDVANVIVYVPESINGQNITITVNKTSKNATVKNGEAKANFTDLPAGKHLITADYLGDDYNCANSTNAALTVSKRPTEISIENKTLNLFAEASVNTGATLTPPDAGNLTYTSSNPSVAIVENGKIKGIRQGEANITVSFAGNENYTAAENKTIAVTVNLNDASVTVNNETLNLEVGQNFTIVANTVPEGVNVTYVQDDSGVYIVDENGVVTALAEGTAIITVEVGDGEIYAINSTNITVNVKKINTAMDISAGEITEGENATITITLPGDATGNVNTTVNGKTYSSEVKDGKAVITIPDLLKGDYTLPITYSGDDKYNPLTKDLNITVEGGKAIISAPELVKYYSGPERFTVNLTYARGSPAANKPVNITLNGVTYPRTTDENGIASLNINLGAGEYPVSVVVDDVLVNSTVTVKSTIDASDVVKMFRNDTQYYARFSDANGTALANTNVSFNINGVIYNRTTDGNGTAKLNINLGAGDYILTAINPITGEMESNTIKVISQIESSDLTKYYKNASQFVVHIHSDDGSYVGAGEEVTFNINGVFYTRTTNATGHAKLNINLPQGNYTITTQYKNCTQSNEIAVLPVLNADNLVMKYRDGSQFKAKLVDGQGKAYAGQSVQFNINGVLYNRETGSDGIAKLNINLMSGEYIITSSYNGFNIANKITIKS